MNILQKQAEILCPNSIPFNIGSTENSTNIDNTKVIFGTGGKEFVPADLRRGAGSGEDKNLNAENVVISQSGDVSKYVMFQKLLGSGLIYPVKRVVLRTNDESVLNQELGFMRFGIQGESRNSKPTSVADSPDNFQSKVYNFDFNVMLSMNSALIFNLIDDDSRYEATFIFDVPAFIAINKLQ